MKIDNRTIKSYIFFGAIAGSVVYFCLCGIKTLNPFNYDWILNIYHDSTLSFWGWIFYEKSPISEGLFSCVDMSYPHALSIIFSDTIVPFAIVLKPIVRTFLEEHTIIQYIGAWSLTCYILQGIFAAIFFYKSTRNSLARLIGIFIMCLSPTMVQRLFMHNTLVAQWLILAAMCICIYRYELGNKRYVMWVILYVIAVSTHIYFVPIISLILIPEMFYEVISNRKNLRPAIITGILCLTTSIAVVFILGGFSTEISDADQAWSYTILYKYSSNLMTWFIPLGNSLFIPDLPSMGEEYEGYAYLGLGMILAVILAISILIILKKNKDKMFENKSALLCLIFCLLLSVIIGIGPRITFFDKELLNINLPGGVDYFFAIFRSIGRFIWVAYYIIIGGSISLVAEKGSEIVIRGKNVGVKLINFTLIVILFLQIIDLSPMVINKRDTLKNIQAWETKMSSNRWEEVKDNFDYVYIISADMVCSPSQEAYSMYMYAYYNDMKLTSSYFAHMNDTLKNESIQYYEDILQGNARKRTLYWFENDEYYENAKSHIHCEVIDGYRVGWVE